MAKTAISLLKKITLGIRWPPLIILLIAGLILLYNIDKPFWGHHDFNNAFYGNMGRNLARYGPVATGFGQVTNTGWVDAQNFSFHTHHPPLLIWLLGSSYFLFGVNEISTRLVPILFSAATLAVFYLLIKKVFDKKTAVASSLIWLVMPIFLYFGKMAIHEVLVLFFFGLALYFHEQRRFKLLILSLILGCLSGWPAYYIPLIILFLQPNFTKKILLIPLLAFILLLAQNYYLTKDLFGGGLITAYSFRTAMVPIFDYIRKEFFWVLAYYTRPVVIISSLGLIYAIINDRKNAKLLMALGMYGLIYLLVFPSAAYRHDYLIYYFLPFITVSAGYLMARFNKIFLIFLLLVSILSSYKFTSALFSSDYMRDGYIAGKLINSNVGKNENVAVLDSEIYNNSGWVVSFYGDRKMAITTQTATRSGYVWTVKRTPENKLEIYRL